MDFLPITSNGQKVYAGFPSRFGAALIDFFVLMPVSFLFIWLEGFDRTLAIASILLSSMLFGLYNVFFNAYFGGTFGKLVVNVRVTKPDGSKIGWGEAWKRSSVEISFAVLFVIVEVWGLLQVDPVKYASLDWLGRSGVRMEHYPVWYGAVFILQQIWVWGELIVLLLNKRKRALHDFIGGTVVIQKEFALSADGKR